MTQDELKTHLVEKLGPALEVLAEEGFCIALVALPAATNAEGTYVVTDEGGVSLYACAKDVNPAFARVGWTLVERIARTKAQKS